MKVTVNGAEKELRRGATLKDAAAGEPYVKGALMSVHLSTERLIRESGDFEVVTTAGSIVLRLDESQDAEMWKSLIADVPGMTARWVTHNIAAFGAIPTGIRVDRTERMYRRYDCFFSLGGFDNRTTYVMLAKDDHRWAYGAGPGRIGRVVRGRHILDTFKEGDAIVAIRPVTSVESTENVVVTSDPKYRLEEGCSVDTRVHIALNPEAPEAAEHVMILAGKGYMGVSDATGSYAACSDDTDVSMPDGEPCAVRMRGSVTVRKEGHGLGRVFFYRDRRQMSTSHTDAGTVDAGMAIAAGASAGDRIVVTTTPSRLLSVGMTQEEGRAFLEAAGVRQIRRGEVSDDSIIAEQVPERTVDALRKGSVETVGISRDRLFKVSFDRKRAPESVRYFEKVTGLSHKPVGILKVHFTFEGLPMVTFEGDRVRGQDLYPAEPFKRCRRGDIGVTNQARPYRGLIGLRLQDSADYGPTGEEPYGTNILGRFEDDFDRLMDGLEDGALVYIEEAVQ